MTALIFYAFYDYFRCSRLRNNYKFLFLFSGGGVGDGLCMAWRGLPRGRAWSVYDYHHRVGVFPSVKVRLEAVWLWCRFAKVGVEVKGPGGDTRRQGDSKGLCGRVLVQTTSTWQLLFCSMIRLRNLLRQLQHLYAALQPRERIEYARLSSCRAWNTVEEYGGSAR